MPPAPDQVFVSGLDAFGDVVAQVSADDWSRPSSCDGWTNLDVLGHLGGAMGMGIDILEGRQPTFPEAERPRDLVDGEPVAFWAGIAERAHRAVEGVDVTEVKDSPRGPRSVGDGLAFPAIDLFVHAWDIGHAVGLDVTVPDDVIEFAHAYLDPIPDAQMRGAGKPFGEAVDAPVDATRSEAFLAWTGRRPR